MPIFTPTQISLLEDIARSRAEQLEMEALQPYADYLYDIIAEDIHRNASSIFSDLLRAVRDTRTPDSVPIPIWHFVSCYPPLPQGTVDRDDSYIGVFDPTQVECDTPTWPLPPVSYDTLFRKTDLCVRLTALFTGSIGGPGFWIHPHYNTKTRTDEEDHYRDWWRNDLILTFYPQGLDPSRLAQIRDVNAKYDVDYTPRPIGEHEIITTWRGAQADPPKTPPLAPANATTVPPLLPIKRAYTLIAGSEDEDEGKGDDGAESPISHPCFCDSCVKHRFQDSETPDE